MTSAASEPLIVEDLRVQRRGFDLHIERLVFARGELTVLLGTSGVGKSSVAAAIAGVPLAGTQTEGRRSYAGRTRRLGEPGPNGERAERAREVALAGQFGREGLDPIGRIETELRRTLLRSGLGPAEARTQAVALLDNLGLPSAELGSRRPSELSEGMAQRVALAMALAQRARLTIFDEPLGPLDHDNAGRALQSMAAALAHGSCLWVTHGVRTVAALKLDQPVHIYRLVEVEPGKIRLRGPVKVEAIHELVDAHTWGLT